jgi:3-oxoacyl-[acyl-carrier protein] reductase
MGKLTGRVAIVTGAASGIGRGIAEAFAVEGAAVAVADKNEHGAQTVSEEIAAGGGRAIAVYVDVTDEALVTAMVERVLAELGGGIDVLVNNAGINGDAPLVEMSLATWRHMIDVNLTSMFLCTRAVLPTMIAQRSGRIINMGSQLALIGGDRMAHYTAAKAGVHGLTKALAHELAPHNINVNTIAPGPIETPLLDGISEDWLEKKRSEMPFGRFGRVEEIAPTAVLLASDGGSFYTGATLNVSGGDVMY